MFRVGYGQFYDHIPMDVYAFSRYPARTITGYAQDGSIAGVPVQYQNVIGDVTGPRSFLVNGKRVARAFSPRGATWNVQLEHAFSGLLRVRAVYTDNRSVGLIVLKNLTNHFNPLAIHNNIADPQYGTFFGNYRRRYRFDFDIIL